MRKINQKIIAILLMVILLIMCMGINSNFVYGKTEAEELKELLDDYAEDLGDLNQFKSIVDETYNDLYNATKVDDTLKEKLKKNIEKFEKIDDINPLIVSILDIELNSQINNLSDDNIEEMREEITAIKEWVDTNVSGDSNDANDTNDNIDSTTSDIADYISGSMVNQNSSSDDVTIAGTQIPRAGIRCVFYIILVIAIILTIVFCNKYIKLREIK